MYPTIHSGKHFVQNANLTGSRFENVCLTKTEFNNVNLAQAAFHNIDLSDITITAAQLGGATFKHIGLPPGSPGKQRPLKFEGADLNESTFADCDLSGVKINNCNLHGMTIDGLLITDLIAAYKQNL